MDADEDYDDGEEQGEEYYDEGGQPYRPPGNEQDGEKQTFRATIPKNFIVPDRLCDKPYELIEAANDWHYAMMNDHPRNVFYRDALRHIITPESVVLEIGAGSGLLSIIAASLGAKTVVAIEANRHLAAVAREIIRRNGHEGRIHIINKMSTEVAPEEIAHYGTPTVLLSEILGTLLLGESALHYVMDARQRLVAPSAAVVPRRGAQFASLIESDDIASITSVRSWEGIDLGWFNTLQASPPPAPPSCTPLPPTPHPLGRTHSLPCTYTASHCQQRPGPHRHELPVAHSQDTTSMVFTKQYGFRFSSCNYRELAERTPVLQLDFAQDSVGIWRGERRTRMQATKTGTIHASFVGML
jgi:protein arginine N-methyltransferase 7